MVWHLSKFKDNRPVKWVGTAKNNEQEHNRKAKEYMIHPGGNRIKGGRKIGRVQKRKERVNREANITY